VIKIASPQSSQESSYDWHIEYYVFGRMYMAYMYVLSSEIHISEDIFKNCKHSQWLEENLSQHWENYNYLILNCYT